MLKLISRLPLRVLHAFAALLYVLAYYVARHRRRLIAEQLERVFPEASASTRRRIHKQFIRNFCDVAVELLKSMTMSPAAMRERVRIVNVEVARLHLDRGRSVLFVTSHLCNWEWLLHGVVLHLGYPLDAAYKPLKDAWAERLMQGLRARFGARLVPAKELLADHLRRRGIVRALALNADQAPVSAEHRHWTRFLGQDTAFYLGAEQIARATRLPVINVAMRRVRRGFYEAELAELWDGKEATALGEITERYARACERSVYSSPADWLWSYRRWRLQRPLYGGST
jgi:KDO2-lipid IV(A) lauroyltransferase